MALPKDRRAERLPIAGIALSTEIAPDLL